jgi:hypothetical protein
MKFLVDLSLDGYDSQDEMEKACLEFLEDQLNFAGSSVRVKKLTPGELDAIDMWNDYGERKE